MSAKSLFGVIVRSAGLLLLLRGIGGLLGGLVGAALSDESTTSGSVALVIRPAYLSVASSPARRAAGGPPGLRNG
jgi:predicted MFS family arabinose efflux permease